MRWFTPSAEKKMRKKPVRRSPVPSKSPSPAAPKMEQVHRMPELRKPKVEMPFVQPSSSLHSHGASETDLSEEAMNTLINMAEEQGVSIRQIKWVNPSPSKDDDNWCRTLSAHAGWPSFDSLWAMKNSKPEEYRVKDSRRGYTAFNGIMGISHAGCDCYLTVSMSDGSMYHISSSDMAPRQVVPPRVVKPVAPPAEEGEGESADELE